MVGDHLGKLPRPLWVGAALRYSVVMRDMTAGQFDEGFAFNYEMWTPGTQVSLLNVPWSSDYQDIVSFPTREAQNEYFQRERGRGRTVEVTKLAYARVGEPVRLAIPFNEANRFNYMRVTNQQRHVDEPTRTYYYFIQDVRHVSPSVTEFSVLLDVWQTYMHDVSLGRAYVEQGHVGIAQENSHKDYGREFLMEPEGFEMGAEMVTLSAHSTMLGAKTTAGGDADTSLDIIMWSNTNLASDWGSMENPNMELATGTIVGGLPQAMSLYFFKDQITFKSFVAHVAKCPWIAQGIMSINAIPGGLIKADVIKEQPYSFTDTGNVKVAGKVSQIEMLTPNVRDVIVEYDIRGKLNEYMGARYKNLKKFLTAPYSMVEVTTYTGAPLMLRPECIYEKKLIMRLLPDLSLPSPKVIMTPLGYNARSYTKPSPEMGKESFYGNVDGDFLDVQTGLYSLPSLSLLNDAYLSYMSSNASSIAFQHSSAEWSQQKALAGNNLAFDQSSAGIALNSEMNRLGNQQAIVGTGIGVAGSMIGGATSGGRAGVGGALVGGAMGAMGAASSVANTANSVYHNNKRTEASNANAAYVRDTNKAYGDFAARGDYAQSIAAINAKAQDMKVVAPTTIGQVGGEQFALTFLDWSIFCKVKCVQRSALVAIGEYWLRYGYKINRFYDFQGDLKRLLVMDKFTYWRLRECYIRTSTAPEAYRMAIRGILEKGVTVWRNPDDIGRIDPGTNTPVFGKYL